MPEKKDEITRRTFDHLVELAALELDSEESEYILKELNNQLTAIHELAAIDIPEDVKAASHGVPYTDKNSQLLRDDDWQACKNPDAILEQTPESQDRYIIVPDIPHTILE